MQVAEERVNGGLCGVSGGKGGWCGVSDGLKEGCVGFKEISGVMLG